ncbi:MFS-type transporter SLC18B1 [Tribolium castaneum]|uniref:MFS-type transporter SLC18B1 n=1 Tax=Tribolium castaneum TaxID=7070 RepID=UPI00046C3655|nr:PREDICTED: MFS-type transporter SLC18B1-like [Tribolium castaneum]XP_015836085.1 PREDICTED: MFS-type transporter SLC18B1-like [Tribolium castaneum]|eukprot:XP_008193647.1 PREDICTED: MFS-type transporter SLC18B1-like [Tribolium castaneum]
MKYSDLPSPESPDSSRSSFNISSSTDGNRPRSKSLSNIFPDNYSPGEIHRIKERLLRTNSRLERSTFKSFTRKQKLTLTSLALVDFISFCSMSIMAPFFPREAAEKGLSDTVSGFIFSFYALVMFLTSPIFGKILPKFGAKGLFLSGMLMAGICNLLFATLEYVKNYTLFTTCCIVIRGFEALGASAFSTASYVFVVNTFPQNIGSVLGILETFVGLGMSTGPALGGVLYSLGGFSMPFFVLGIVMVLFVPLNLWMLPKIEDCNVSNRPPSICRLIRVPTVVITGLVVVIVSSSWAFLDPTLEPHLRQFNLTPEKIGLIFLLFSGLYGVSSPAWGWLADKVNNHWSMMVVGLFMCTIGLLLLGPCPYIPFLKSTLWLNLVALSILGISVALALLPTFQGLLSSAISSGCGDTLSTYSVIAGVWSCVYSLGEVVGPSLGGFLLQHYGFPITSTIMASMTFGLAVITFLFFVFKNSNCKDQDCVSDSGISGSWRGIPSDSDSSETTPLILSSIECNYRSYTEGKLQYYEQSRKHDSQMGEIDSNQVTDVRGTVNVTAGGACEV